MAEYKGRKVGTMGVAASFSFYLGKNLGAMGDAGALVTNDSKLAEWCEQYVRHGGKGEHKIEGINSRLDGLQAAILSVKLPHLDRWTEGRRRMAAQYDALFAQLKGVDDGPEKQALIDRMTTIVQQDAPWSFGYFPYSSGAFQAWVHNAKPAVLVRDMTRYIRIDAAERVRRQAEWNRPVWWPMGLGAVGLIAIVWLALRSFRRREQLDARGVVLS